MPLDPIPHEDGIERFADSATDMVVHRFSAFNADVALQGFGERAACDSALDAARAACRAQERPFSRTLPHSDVARLNRTAGQPATIAPETADALNRDATRFLPLRAFAFLGGTLAACAAAPSLMRFRNVDSKNAAPHPIPGPFRPPSRRFPKASPLCARPMRTSLRVPASSLGCSHRSARVWPGTRISLLFSEKLLFGTPSPSEALERGALTRSDPDGERPLYVDDVAWMSGGESLAGQLAQRGVSVALEIIHADTFHGHCMHDARDAVKVASEYSLRRFFPNLPDRWLEPSGAPVFEDAYCVYRPHELEGTVVDFLRTIGQSHPAR